MLFPFVFSFAHKACKVTTFFANIQIFEQHSFEKVSFGGKMRRKREISQILHLAQQFVGRLLQFDEAEPLLAEVFETCADKINGIVNTQESVMCAVKLLNFNRRLLRIVFLKIKRQLTRDILCVNNRFHAFVPLIQHSQHTIVHIVVDKHNAFLGFAYTLVNK